MSAEEEVLGKAYDSRLMRRLLTYLRAYKCKRRLPSGHCSQGLAEGVGPFLVKVEIDKYLVRPHQSAGFLDGFLSPTRIPASRKLGESTRALSL